MLSSHTFLISKVCIWGPCRKNFHQQNTIFMEYLHKLQKQMHYPLYDGIFFQACAMQAIYPLFMKFQCVICILYQNLLSIHVYMLLQAHDSTGKIIITLIRIHIQCRKASHCVLEKCLSLFGTHAQLKFATLCHLQFLPTRIHNWLSIRSLRN
jgi:hypothetical protein